MPLRDNHHGSRPVQRPSGWEGGRVHPLSLSIAGAAAIVGCPESVSHVDEVTYGAQCDAW